MLDGGSEMGRPKGDGSFMQTTIMAAANIKEMKLTPKRASPRLAKNAGTDSMSKAKKRAAWRNLDCGAGNTSNLSFIQFLSVNISSHLSDIDVSSGCDPDSVSKSISLLKNVELSRYIRLVRKSVIPPFFWMRTMRMILKMILLANCVVNCWRNSSIWTVIT